VTTHVAMLRYVFALLLILLHLGNTAIAQSQELVNGVINLNTKFGAGQYKSAIEVSEDVIKIAEKEHVDAVIFLRHLLVDFCMRAYDPDCAAKNISKSANLIGGKLKDAVGIEREKYTGLLISDIAKSIMLTNLTRNYQGVDKLILPLEQLLSQMVALSNPIAYIDGQLALTYWFLKDGDKAKASLAIDKAWLYFVALENTSVPDLIKYGTQFSTAFQIMGMQKKSIYIAQIIRPLVVNNGNLNKYDALRFALINRNISVGVNNMVGSIASMEYALELVNGIEMPDYQAEYFKNMTKASILIDCAQFVSEKMCGKSFAYETDLYNYLENRVKDLSIDPGYKVMIAQSLALYRIFSNKKIDGTIVDGLSLTLPKSVWDDGATISHASTVELSKFLLAIAQEDKEEAKRRIINSAEFEVIRMKKNISLNPLESISLNSHQRTLFGLASLAIAEFSKPNSEMKELMFDMMEMSNLTTRNIEAQYLKILSATSDRAEQTALQAYYRLRQDGELMERNVLAKRINGSISGKAYKPDGNLINSELLVKLSNIREDLEQFNWIAKGNVDGQNLNNSGLRNLQNILKDNEAYINYMPTSQGLVISCTVKDHIMISVSRVNEKLNTDIKLLQAALSNPSPPSKEVDGNFPTGSAVRMTELLLEPIKDCIKNKRHIYFIQDDSVAGLSHHILLDPHDINWKNITEDSPKKIPWIGKRYSISLLSGASHLVSSRKIISSSNPNKPFLGVGNPLLTGETSDGQVRGRSIIRGVRAGDTLKELDELPDTEHELKAMAKYFGVNSKLLTGIEGTELAVRRTPLRSYDVISFATHGLTKEEIPGLTEPALVLTPQDSTQEMDDGLLTATDISRLDLNARLVILSACNTGRYTSDMFSTEAASLSTAFFLGGAKATLASLWSVNSVATRLLMEKFSENYKLKNNTAFEALKASMNNLMESDTQEGDFSHPRYWASFMFYGDAGITSFNNEENHDKLKLIVDEQFLNKKGHIREASILKDEVFLVGAYPVDEGNIYTGNLRGVDSKGNVKWSHSLSRHFFNIVKGQKSGDLMVLQYPYYEDVGPFSILKILNSGEIIRKIDVDRNVGEAGYSAIFSGTIVYIFSKNLTNSNLDESITVRAWDLKSNKLVGMLQIKPQGQLSNLKLIGINTNYGVKLALSGTNYVSKSSTKINDLGLINPCLGDKYTEIISLDSNLQENSNRFVYKNIEITSMHNTWDEKELWGFTELRECKPYEIKIAGILLPDNLGKLNPIFVDFKGYKAAPTVITETKEGYAVAGYVSRRFVSSSIDNTNISTKENVGLINSDPDRQTGVFVVGFDKKFNQLGLDILFNGIDVFMEDAVEKFDKITYFGSSGDRQFSADYYFR